MARHVHEPYDSDDSLYRPSRRRRRHHHHHHRDADSDHSRRRRSDSPDLDDAPAARTEYYARAPGHMRRRSEAVPRHGLYDDHSDRSLGREYSAAEGLSRRRHEDDGARRRTRGRDEARDDDENVVYVYPDRDGSSFEDAPRHEPLERRASKTPERVRVREWRRERPRSRRVDTTVDGREYDPPRRTMSTRRAPPTRTVSVRDHDRPRVSSPSVRRSSATVRPRPASVVESTRPQARPRSSSGKAAASLASPRSNPRASIFSIFVPPPPPSQPRPERLVECVVCMADDIPTSKSAKLACGHCMCQPCLKRQFTLSVTDPQHMPPRCCSADHIPLRHVEKLLSDKFKRLWNRKYEEYMTKNRLYCPRKGCGNWIKPSHIHRDSVTGRKYGKCTKCAMKVCTLCNGRFHTKKECPKDEDTNRFAEMAKEKGWQRCYNCKAMVELKEGCYHMTCRCTAQFCMLCGQKWKTCDCPWFATPPLDPDDRLLNMNIPQPIQAIFNVFQPHSPAAAPAPVAAQPAPAPAPITRTTSRLQRRNTRRQQQEDEDERFARRLQSQLYLDPEASIPDLEPVNVEVYGLGNAGVHHMNESYTVRPIAHNPAPNPPRRSWIFGTRLSPRTSQTISSGQESGAATPKSSTMAGLAYDGSRRGANRVNTWLQYVENDPAEVEGRNIVQPIQDLY